MRLRTNHSTQRNTASLAIRLGLFLICLLLLFGITKTLVSKIEAPDTATASYIPPIGDDGERFFLPGNTKGEILHYKEFSLSYSPEHRQAEWVAYIFEAEKVFITDHPFEHSLKEDKNLQGISPLPDDFVSSGYEMGQLVSAEFMAHDPLALEQSFLMSNVSPQHPGFKQGIWRELGAQIKEWVAQKKTLLVITGPVLNAKLKNKLGTSQISVPELFYKIVMDISSPDKNTIAFLIPNTISSKPLEDYLVSVSYLEDLTGIHFFNDLFSEDYQREIKQLVDVRNWEFNPKIFKERIEEWNNKVIK
jgi:endonuclease G, mitochondrial